MQRAVDARFGSCRQVAGSPAPRSETRGAEALYAAPRQAAREGVGRGLRQLYAETLEAPLPKELAELIARFPGT